MLYNIRMNLRREIDADEIRRLYLDENRTMAELAEHYGCGEATIRRRLDDLGITTHPRGPRLSQFLSESGLVEWSADLAYAVGLIATDGNLSKDGRHMCVVSKDIELLETLRECLNIENSITPHEGGWGDGVYGLQWGSRNFYNWLLGIGLMPAKSLQLGPLIVPDEYLADFTRGCIDGDGTIVTYTDRYNTFKSEKYVYERLFVAITSASYPFLEWLQNSVSRVLGVSGALFLDRDARPNRAAIWELKYAKHESIQLLRWMYYSPDVPCLARKRDKALPFLISAD